MALTDDITTQRQKHGKVTYLLHKLQEQRTEELKAETSMAHDIEGELGTLFLILDDLAKIGLTPLGYAMLERALNERNTRTALNIKLVLTELIERRKGGDLS